MLFPVNRIIEVVGDCADYSPDDIRKLTDNQPVNPRDWLDDDRVPAIARAAVAMKLVPKPKQPRLALKLARTVEYVYEEELPGDSQVRRCNDMTDKYLSGDATQYELHSIAEDTNTIAEDIAWADSTEAAASAAWVAVEVAWAAIGAVVWTAWTVARTRTFTWVDVAAEAARAAECSLALQRRVLLAIVEEIEATEKEDA